MKKNRKFRLSRRKSWLTALFLTVIIAVGAAGSIFTHNNTEGQMPDGEMSVHFIDIGQGDSTLIKCGNHAMLIDAGENDCGTKVQAYLESQGVTKLDYVIGTHPDSDHIGASCIIQI